MFAAGDYQPLEIGEGRNSDRVCAFSRRHGDEVLAVAVPRLTFGLFRDGGPADFGATDIALPAVQVWRDVFTGGAIEARDRIRAAELFRQFPVSRAGRDGAGLICASRRMIQLANANASQYRLGL